MSQSLLELTIYESPICQMLEAWFWGGGHLSLAPQNHEKIKFLLPQERNASKTVGFVCLCSWCQHHSSNIKILGTPHPIAHLIRSTIEQQKEGSLLWRPWWQWMPCAGRILQCEMLVMADWPINISFHMACFRHITHLRLTGMFFSEYDFMNTLQNPIRTSSLYSKFQIIWQNH